MRANDRTDAALCGRRKRLDGCLLYHRSMRYARSPTLLSLAPRHLVYYCCDQLGGTLARERKGGDYSGFGSTRRFEASEAGVRYQPGDSNLVQQRLRVRAAKVDPSGAYRTDPIENHDRYVRLSYRAVAANVMVVNDLCPLAM